MFFSSFKYFAFLFIVYSIFTFLKWCFGTSYFRMSTMSDKLKSLILFSVLLFSSAYFYISWSLRYFFLIAGSILFNYLIGLTIEKLTQYRRTVLFIGIFVNVLVLFYYKYLFFVLGNIDLVFGTEFCIEKIILPLAISFFTFQQIAYISDCYMERMRPETSLLKYALFVMFFPKLVSGPIVNFQKMRDQFDGLLCQKTDYEYLVRGIFRLTIGLFKKVVIADTLALIVQQGYADGATLNLPVSAISTFGYALQLYFDFSGYTDMAIGSAMLFGIRLPENFNSPYIASSIRDFWRRWHITLSTWVRDYIYIPLGGSRTNPTLVCCNLFISFFIIGIWHGAGWTFIAWGILHGLAVITNYIWSKSGIRLPNLIGRLSTFVFVSFAWVLFKAESLDQAFFIYNGFFKLTRLPLNTILGHQIGLICTLCAAVMILPNSRSIENSISELSAYTQSVWISLLISIMFFRNYSAYYGKKVKKAAKST